MLVEYAPDWTDDFVWVVYLAFIVAFLVAFGMGANDCANSYGTVVGAGVLKLWQAYVLATIFETLGAGLLGYKVTNTMRKQIVDVSVYDVHSQKIDDNGSVSYRLVDSCNVDRNNSIANYNVTGADSGDCTDYTSALFMLGELGVLIGTAFWLILATVIHLPVSTTHSAVGATLGFSLVLKGPDGINWGTIVNIVVSWVASPALAGFFSVVFYLIIKYTVLNRAFPFESSLQVMPLFYFFALTVNCFSILYDGSKYLMFDKLAWWVDLIISLSIGTTAALIIHFWGKHVIRRRVLQKMAALSSTEPKMEAANRDLNGFCDLVNSDKEKNGTAACAAMSDSHGLVETHIEARTGENGAAINSSLKDVRFTKINSNGANNDSGFELTPARLSKYQTRNASTSCTQIGESLSPTPYIVRREPQQLDAKSLKEKLKLLKRPVEENPLAAQVFNYLQIMSACFLSFSHGSNDTANAVGPLVGLWLVYKNGNAAKESQYDMGMLLLILFGAVSMIIGLWILGHKVITTIGTKITQVTPPSGFAMELGTGFTVLVASKIGIPISTTHCAVGAVVCVGWFKSHEGGVSWKIFRNIAIAWVVTLPVASAVAALAAYLLSLLL